MISIEEHLQFTYIYCKATTTSLHDHPRPRQRRGQLVQRVQVPAQLRALRDYCIKARLYGKQSHFSTGAAFHDCSLLHNGEG